MGSFISLFAGLVLGTIFGYIFHDDIKNIFMR
jgi:ABC-type dipeptide/oligopeptide/nickel transport system permease subunit